jgi:hypothetical protein
VAVVQEDVFGLDIPVDHALPVGVIERARDLAGEPHRLRDPELLFREEPVAQRLAADERHDIPEKPVGRARVDQPEDVGMLQVGGGLDLLKEPLGADDRGELRAQHLEGDLAIVPLVVGQVDRRHTAGTELALDRVAIGERRLKDA